MSFNEQRLIDDKYLAEAKVFLECYIPATSCGTILATPTQSGRDMAEQKKAEILQPLGNKYRTGMFRLANGIYVKLECVPDMSVPRDAYKLMVALVIRGEMFGYVDELISFHDTVCIWSNDVKFGFKYHDQLGKEII